MINFFRTKQTIEKSWLENHPEYGKITFTINKHTKALRLSVKPFQGLQISLPVGFPKRDINLFIRKKEKWIQQALERTRQTELKSQQFFSSQATIALSEIRKTLVERLDSTAKQHGFTYNKVSLRNQSSRWASCSGNNNISLNQKLYYLPKDLCNYVLLHELAHTIQKNHGPKFWKILYDILGEQTTKDRKQGLKDFEFLFHPPLEP